jgi:hypothetical protein
MRPLIWEWIVEADNYVGELALDAALAILSVAVNSGSLRSFIAWV